MVVIPPGLKSADEWVRNLSHSLVGNKVAVGSLQGALLRCPKHVNLRVELLESSLLWLLWSCNPHIGPFSILCCELVGVGACRWS
jgi:hypothetical protein